MTVSHAIKVNQKIRQTLLDLQKTDLDTRARLMQEGKLFEGYAEEMAAVHERNAEQLQAIIDKVGWPGKSLVGEDGAQAAWRIAQHAIGLPKFQRTCLEHIHEVVKQREMPLYTEAYLTDRIRFNQRQPQVYGTIFDWDEQGELSPWRIEDEENVEKRRQEMGLPPLEEDIQKMQASARDEGNRPPTSYHARQQEIESWAIQVGWIET